MTFLWWKIERLSACNPEKRFWKAFLLAARIELRGIYPLFSKTCSHWIDCMVCTMYMLAYGCFSTLGCSKPVVILGHPLWWSWHQSPRWHLCHSCFNPLLYLCHFNPWKKTHQHPAIPSPHMKTHQPNCHHLPPSNTSFIAAGEASPGHHICLEASSWRGRPQVKRLTPSTASGWKRTSNLGEIFNQKERWDVGQLWDMTQKSPPKSEEPYPQVLGFASKIQSLCLLGILSTNMGTLPIFVNVGNRFGSYAWRRNTPSIIWSMWEQNKKSHNTGDDVYICGHWPHMGHVLALLGGNGLHIVW